jgi:putative hydrolase of the HAD superfamily
MIVFDFCGVLGDWPTEDDRATMQGVAGRPGPSFWADYWRHRPPYDVGAVSEREYWALVAPGITSSRASLLEALDVASWSRPRPHMLALVADLSEPTAILSNAPAGLARLIDTAPWGRIFTPRLFSADLGVAKPDRAAYQRLAERVQLPPRDLVFVDDRIENVTAARAAGLRGVHFNDPATLPEQIRKARLTAT